MVRFCGDGVTVWFEGFRVLSKGVVLPGIGNSDEGVPAKCGFFCRWGNG